MTTTRNEESTLDENAIGTNPLDETDEDTRPTTPDVFTQLLVARTDAATPRAFLTAVTDLIRTHFGARDVLIACDLDGAFHRVTPTDGDAVAHDGWRAAIEEAVLHAHAATRGAARLFGANASEPTCAVVTAPMRAPSGECVGAIGLLAPVSSEAAARSTMIELASIAAHVTRALSAGIGGRSGDALASAEELADVLSRSARYESLEHFAIAIANGLRGRLECEQVCIGQSVGDDVRLVAISGLDHVRSRGPAIRVLRQAMSETRDAGVTIVSQHGAGWSTDRLERWRLHEQWRAESSDASVASIPLRAGDDVVAVVTFRRAADRPFTEDEIVGAERLVRPLGACWNVIARTHRPLVSHVFASARRSVLGPILEGRIVTIALQLLAVATLLWFCFGKLDYSLALPATVRAETTLVAAAPFDGRLADVLVRPGDAVRAGQPLARLATEELELDRSRAIAERDESRLRARLAAAEDDAATGALHEAAARAGDARIALIDRRIAAALVRAPANGVVLGPDPDQRRQDVVAIGAPIVEIVADGGLGLEVAVPERRLVDLDDATGAAFRSAARPENADTVELIAVQPATELRDGRNVFLAQASMPVEQTWLRPGMEGVVHVELGRRPVWWLAFHRTIDWFHLEFGGVE